MRTTSSPHPHIVAPVGCGAAWYERIFLFLAWAEPFRGTQVTHCRYEDLVADPLSEGMRILQEFGYGRRHQQAGCSTSAFSCNPPISGRTPIAQ